MRFPVVWITLALCVVLCRAGPVSRTGGLEAGEQAAVSGAKEQQRAPPSDFMRGPRQQAYVVDEDSEEDEDEGPAYASSEDDDEEYERRSFGRSLQHTLRRTLRDIAQRPVADVEEESVLPAEGAAPVADKRPSVLELLSTALDKAIEATSKIPTQQVASDAAGVFHILGQVFSEAIDKVIGGDDGPEEAAENAENAETPEVAATEAAAAAVDTKGPEDPPAPSPDAEPMQADPQQESSQSDKETVANL